MAIYSSKKRYECGCGSCLFREDEVFLIEEEMDNTKLSPENSYKREGNLKRVVCASCGIPIPYPYEKIK